MDKLLKRGTNFTKSSGDRQSFFPLSSYHKKTINKMDDHLWPTVTDGQEEMTPSRDGLVLRRIARLVWDAKGKTAMTTLAGHGRLTLFYLFSS
jgi:hypothetical protein